jgi:lipid-A-disaccharide synthase
VRTASGGDHIFLSCGEASGERYGAELVAALRRQDPSLRFSALGGPALAAAGATLIESASDIAVMGFTDVVSALPRILTARRNVWRHLARGDIDLCVPIDFPGFNLGVAGKASSLGIPVFYLIPPQLWAWGRWRVGKLRRNVDRIGTILPFEAEFYRRQGVPAMPLGHPLMEDYAHYPFERLVAEREKRLADPAAPLTIGLLPGSRRQEIRRLLPPLRVAANIVSGWLPGRRLSVVVSAAPGIDLSRMMKLVAAGFDISEEPLPRLLERLDLALVCSGTASLEVALAGIPHELVYITSGVNYWLGKRLLRVKRLGLANLILNQDMVREHIQAEATPLAIARSLMSWVRLPQSRRLFYQQARQLREMCGEPGVWERAAAAVKLLLSERSVTR